MKLKKIKLKGNESFNFREGWLRKGMRCVKEDEALFSREDVMERLGVGSKMVKSIRYWLLATDLCEEQYRNSGRSRALVLTKDFGDVINQYDPYFDDVFSLFLLHYHIVSNSTMCMPWFIFFNEFEGQGFSKENMVNFCRESLNKKMEEGATFSEKLFEDDCASILRMYLSNSTIEDPEDSLACPLSSLGLISKNPQSANTYIKTMPSRDILDKLAILYVIASNFSEGKTSVSINELLTDPNNIGRVFNLSRVAINEYLDQLRISEYLTINRTAGLDMVYQKKAITPVEILMEYYTKAQVEKK